MLRPLGQEDYYTKRGGANVLGMLKSPVVLMMLASGAMMFALPKIMVCSLSLFPIPAPHS